jgi:hypothetical protein
MKALRLVNKDFCHCTTPKIFKSISFPMRNAALQVTEADQQSHVWTSIEKFT